MRDVKLEDYIELGKDIKKLRKSEIDYIDRLSYLFGRNNKLTKRAKTILEKTDDKWKAKRIYM